MRTNFLKYSDDEVLDFHPFCKRALEGALLDLELESTYEVIHHYSIDGIIPDFVIQNRATKKILLIIEVKRTPSQVMSTRYRLQAQSYILSAQAQRLEQAYYVLTNLEVSYLFKNNERKTAVNNQMVHPSPIISGRFIEQQTKFEQQLRLDFKTMIDIAYQDLGQYQLNYDDIVNVLEQYVDDIEKWHSAITVFGYELIRSVLINNNRKDIENWSNAGTYRKSTELMQQLISTIDFSSLGTGTIHSGKNEPFWQTQMLAKAAQIGERTYSGDEFASIAHELLIRGHESKGVVPTDMELAAALAELVTSEIDNPESANYFDPASGGGNLLSAIIDRYPNIMPNKIWANDEIKFLEDILSIRFGLKFPNNVSPENAPKITSENITSYLSNDFQDVDVLLMNPPYVSGVSDSHRKKGFVDKIKVITEKKALTNIGQMPIEGPFLELAIALCKSGTTMGIVFPEQHLFGKGRESKAIRELLLYKFGLKKVFTYPRTGLFEEVVKGTVILIGEKGKKTQNIEVINSSVPIEEIDLKALSKESIDSYGIEKRKVSIEDLSNNLKVGWKFALYPNYEALIALIQPSVAPLDKSSYRRGPNDNGGEGKYLYITKQGYWNLVEPLVPKSWLISAIQNTRDYSSKKIISDNNTVKALYPPKTAFVLGSEDNKLLMEILEIAHQYLLNISSSGSQKKKLKTADEVFIILKGLKGRITPAGRILVPRGLRNSFKIYETTEDTIVSTNFIELSLDSSVKKEAYISWLMSIYGQIQLEFISKPQEGMRKMEIGEFGLVQFPINFEQLSLPIVNSSDFEREFSNYSLQDETDTYWSNQNQIDNQDLLRFETLMAKMIDLRNP